MEEKNKDAIIQEAEEEAKRIKAAESTPAVAPEVAPASSPEEPKKNNNNLPIIIVAILVLLIGGFAVWYFVLGGNDKKSSSNKEENKVVENKEEKKEENKVVENKEVENKEVENKEETKEETKEDQPVEQKQEQPVDQQPEQTEGEPEQTETPAVDEVEEISGLILYISEGTSIGWNDELYFELVTMDPLVVDVTVNGNVKRYNVTLNQETKLEGIKNMIVFEPYKNTDGDDYIAINFK